ncbi:MAG TPA: phage major capsid protein [Gemmatimonadales bacterium]|jgi:hypothetical protein
MADPAIGQVAASVWEAKIGKKPTDNIFNSRALFYAMGSDGFKEDVSGGRLFEFTLEYAENTTHQMQGEMDNLDTTRIDVFDAARYNQKIAAGTVVYSELERLRNLGDGAKFDVIAGKLANGKNSHSALLNRQMWGDGSGPNDIDGIQKLISITPTTGSVGGINGSTFTWWRNRQASGAKTSTAFDNLRPALTSVHNQCSLGGTENKPTALVMDRADLEGLESTMVTLERYTSDDRKRDGDPAFLNDALKFKGLPAMYDEDAPAGEARFINPKFLKVPYLSGGWMKMYPAVDPANQLSNVHKVATVLGMASNARRHLGVVSAIT